MWCARDELSCGEVQPQVGLHMQTMQSVSRCLLCRAIKNQQPCRVQPSSHRVHGSGGCWLVWSVPVVCVRVCVSWWQANGTRRDSFERDAVGADEEGRRDKSLFLKCNQSGARVVLTGRRRSCFYSHNRNRKWWRGAAAQEKWKRLWRRYKRIFFQIADQRLFLKLPSDVFLLSADFSWHQKWKL